LSKPAKAFLRLFKLEGFVVFFVISVTQIIGITGCGTSLEPHGIWECGKY
jgi:hypothetical protein